MGKMEGVELGVVGQGGDPELHQTVGGECREAFGKGAVLAVLVVVAMVFNFIEIVFVQGQRELVERDWDPREATRPGVRKENGSSKASPNQWWLGRRIRK